jgi:hypothetical protein
MKNIFDTDVDGQSNQFNTITTGGIQLLGGKQGDTLIIGDTSGTVEGISIPGSNYVYTSGATGSSLPQYTQELYINTLTLASSLTMSQLVQGDLIQHYGGTFERVPIGTPNQLLTVGALSNVAYQDLQTIISDNSTLNFNTINASTIVLSGTNLNTELNTINTEITNLQNKGYCYATVNSSVFTGVVNSVVYTFPTLYNSVYANNWSVNLGSNIKYNGTSGKIFKVTSVISMTSNQDNSLFSYFLQNNGTVVNGSVVYFEHKSNDYGNYTVSCMVSPNTGDLLTIAFIRNDTGSAAQCNTFSFSICIEQVSS